MTALANADLTVNPNKAGVQQFENSLIGVTEGMASNIIQYRKENGRFSSEEELTRVQGIGWDVVNINQGYLYTGDNPAS